MSYSSHVQPLVDEKDTLRQRSFSKVKHWMFTRIPRVPTGSTGLEALRHSNSRDISDDQLRLRRWKTRPTSGFSLWVSTSFGSVGEFIEPELLCGFIATFYNFHLLFGNDYPQLTAWKVLISLCSHFLKIFFYILTFRSVLKQ